ncbi:MAG: methyltransferase domain-containing protein, partial [Clostridia bacterium]|nr:methyltransferase domain-containing protein [Clostridia bacterium]
GLSCGNPTALAALKPGEVVLDLGSGGGFDVFIAAEKVGPTGKSIGVDMTHEMLTKARKNIGEFSNRTGLNNVEFRLGEIEHLPIADATVDVIISNCVINLSTDKEQVMRETYRVLKKGGRLAISDVLAISEIPDEIRSDSQMLCGCVAGAEKVDTIRELLKNNGFSDISLTRKQNTDEIISSWTDKKRIEEYVASFYIEAKKA